MQGVDHPGPAGQTYASIAITPDLAPNAHLASSPSQPTPGQTVTIDTAGSSVAFGTIPTDGYQWSASGGTCAPFIGPSLHCTFGAGTFTITVRETDSAGTSTVAALHPGVDGVDFTGRTASRVASNVAATSLQVTVLPAGTVPATSTTSHDSHVADVTDPADVPDHADESDRAGAARRRDPDADAQPGGRSTRHDRDRDRDRLYAQHAGDGGVVDVNRLSRRSWRTPRVICPRPSSTSSPRMCSVPEMRWRRALRPPRRPSWWCRATRSPAGVLGTFFSAARARNRVRQLAAGGPGRRHGLVRRPADRLTRGPLQVGTVRDSEAGRARFATVDPSRARLVPVDPVRARLAAVDPVRARLAAVDPVRARLAASIRSGPGWRRRSGQGPLATVKRRGRPCPTLPAVGDPTAPTGLEDRQRAVREARAPASSRRPVIPSLV